MMRVIALGALALTGCGTMENLGRPSNGEPRALKIYGGVSQSVENVNTAFAYPIGFVIPLSFADVPLSAVADTLTLPITVCATLGRAISDGISDYYFPKKPPGEENAWRKFWFDEQQPSALEANSVKRTGESLPNDRPALEPSPARPPAP